MTTPYLIAHLVRGQPAFDIAIHLCGETKPCQPNCGCWDGTECIAEDWWIIPTSGHRAYPYWHSSLEGILQGELCVSLTDSWLAHKLANPPAEHPDHYAPTSAPRGQGLITNLAERLGFVPKPPTITRR